MLSVALVFFSFFFFNDTATTEIYTLSLHDALPISDHHGVVLRVRRAVVVAHGVEPHTRPEDRKSTRLNSSHPSISYAVFCLKKKKNNNKTKTLQYTPYTLYRQQRIHHQHCYHMTGP